MLFSPLFLPPQLAQAVGDRAWIQAMLDAEAALARAEARAGVIPDSAAEAIAAQCDAVRVNADTIALEARQVGNPAEPLVRALRSLVPADAARFVHFGATSQDIVDTASMLIAREALKLLEDELAPLADELANLATEHRDTLMVGRTLLQHALPITFGLKAAQWLAGITRARRVLRQLHDDVLAAQLGGAAGTLASLGEEGMTVIHLFARELGLAEPVLPWHAERSRVAQLGAALALAAGCVDNIALDLVLLTQTEVGELQEAGTGRQGGSSTLPHKQNPVGAVLARACTPEAQAAAEVLTRAMSQEHERAAGAWQSEWQALSGALAFTGAAASHLRQAVERLEIQPERMRENLDMTHGLIMSERIAALLSPALGQERAHDLVRSLGRRVRTGGKNLQDLLLDEPEVRRHLSPEEIERAMDPATYLGSAGAFIDRALAQYRSGRPM